MATPSKSEILEKARALFFENEYKNGNGTSTNPTESELRESGFTSLATSVLMQSKERAYENWLHNETLDVKDLQFNIELAKKRGTFISGSRGSGKSNLGKLLVDKLLKQGYIVKVFDNSQSWRNSSVPNLMTVTSNNFGKVDFGKSCIFDLSLLYLKDQKQFIESTIKRDFEHQAKLTQRHWHFYVFEEVETLLSTHSRSAEILRMVCVGRNFKLSYVALAQRFAMVSPSLVSLAGQLYIGNCHEENDKKKLRNWLGHYVSELEDLNVGEFLCKRGKYVEKMQVPQFKTHLKPVQIQQTQVKPIEPSKPTISNSEAAISLTNLALWSILTLLVISQML